MERILPGPCAAIELWNLHDNVPLWVGAQRIVNLVGRISDPDLFERLSYRLNDGPSVPVFFRTRAATADRLARPGDFNIDTIDRQSLRRTNLLVLNAQGKDRSKVELVRSLIPKRASADMSRFQLEPGAASCAQELGQVVNGCWKLRKDDAGAHCLSILPEDAGLDRIILFGGDGLAPGYRVRARLRINQWLGTRHNIGLLFNWHPHRRGDGTRLPSEWSTGLGYYYSHCRGLRVRIGVDVHLDHRGRKQGDNVLGEAVLSPTRWCANAAARTMTAFRRFVPQIVPGREYIFELAVEPAEYLLTVWPAGSRRPRPQVRVDSRPDLLPPGATGIIAHRCAVDVFDFEIAS